MTGFSALRCWLLLTALAATLAACAAPAPTATPTRAPAPAATPTKAPTATPTKRPLVKVVWSGPAVSTAHLPVWVAKGAGYFPEEGLDVDWVFAGSGAKGVAAVIGGSSTWASAASPDLISAISQSQPIQAFAALTVGQLREIVMRKDVAQAKGVTEKSTLEEKVKALRGLRLGATSPGSGTDYTLRYILLEYNMDPERDVEIAYVGSPDGLVAALAQGSIDAFANNDPQSSQPIQQGFGMMLISVTEGEVSSIKNQIGSILLARKDTMAAQPEVIEGLARATWRAQRLMKQRPDEARVASQTVYEMTDAALWKSIFDRTNKAVPDSPDMTTGLVAGTVAYRNKTTKEAPAEVSFEDFYNPSFVQAAKKQLGY